MKPEKLSAFPVKKHLTLLRKLDEFVEFPTGRKRLAEFQCGYCGSVVKRTMEHGRRDHSCGCQRNKGELNGRYTHGLCQHPLYWVLSAIKNRCNNTNDAFYARYGGRGVTVCEEWSANPASFVRWALANGWKEGLTIDRINNDGNYAPDNCCFTTTQLNCQHSRQCKITAETARQIKSLLETHSQSQIARQLNLSVYIVQEISRGRTWRNV